MLVNIHGGKSHELVESALKVLENMRHRGAEGADNKTGDGAGILLQIPHEFILLQGIPVPEKGKYGTGLLFLPKDEKDQGAILSIIIEEIEKEGLTSSTGGTYGGQYGIYGSSTTKSVNPSDVIAGILIKEGYVILPKLKSELSNETLIVNYGESGRRNRGLGYTIEVTIQFISAKTNEMICSCTAEGQGETEADDIRQAIKRALSSLFPQK